MKVQGKHYNDFTLHSIRTRSKGPFKSVKYGLKNRTLPLIEGPDSPSANNMKPNINAALMDKYKLSMDCFLRAFPRLTDVVANASVSKEIHNPDETWTRFLAHALNYVMKNVLHSLFDGTTLEFVV